MDKASLIANFIKVVGKKQVLTGDYETAPYRQGFREGGGPVLAVLKPQSLWQQWQLLEICTQANLIIITQAANTGLTGGSTPSEGCDRETVVINTSKIQDIHYLEEQNQILALSGASLFSLEKVLSKYGRTPHSIIGSSCIGASIIGGVCNNSGGALVERGPAYTELALYAKVEEDGQLTLVNNLDIELGKTPEDILTRLQNRNYTLADIKHTDRQASDKEYSSWVRDTSSASPARYNADSRRLFEASGCAGKLAVFAVRLDTFLKNEKQQTFFISTNSTVALQQLRKLILEEGKSLPVSAEYIHQKVLSLAGKYGRDTIYLIKRFGSSYLPSFFRIKRKLDVIFRKIPFLGNGFLDRLIHYIFRLFPNPTPEVFEKLNGQYEHHLLLTAKNKGIEETVQFIKRLSGDFDIHCLECGKEDATSAHLLRYACASAAIQYAQVNNKEVEAIVSLDIALRRNDSNWFEVLPVELSNKLVDKLYYGHFLCHVFHQDYIVRKNEDPEEIQSQLLRLVNERGAEYPAEHNVGHHYKAKPNLCDHYKHLDPCNVMNAGIGKMSKNAFYGASDNSAKEVSGQP